MADISKIKLPDGTTYNLRDTSKTDEKVKQESFYSFNTGKRYILTTKEGASSSTNTDTCLKAMDIYCEDGDLVIRDEYEHETHIKGGYIVTGALNCSNGTVQADSVWCNSMSVTDISDQYTFTKTSGSWTLRNILAYRCGNVIHMQMNFRGGGSSVSAGGVSFQGSFTGGPLPIIIASGARLVTNHAAVVTVTSDGSITARTAVENWNYSTTSDLSIPITFITND